ncbi:MAG TPA: serine hydrolase domain-containing protein [Rhodanobacter sp.]
MYRCSAILTVVLGLAMPMAQAGQLVTAPSIAGGAQSRSVSADRLHSLDRYMQAVTGPTGYLGAVTLVMRDGKLVQHRAYGHRDLARRQPMAEDAIFRIYSMSKTVTSVAVLMLLEEGRIGLDDPVSRYLPEFSTMQVVQDESVGPPVRQPAADPITIHQLLTHTAGFPAGLPGDERASTEVQRLNPHGAADLAGFVQRLSRTPLAADPGTRFGYDGAATELLARLVEVVAGVPFADYLHQRLFDPLKMVDTGFYVPRPQRNRVVDITTMGPHGRLVLADGPSAKHPGEPLNPYTSGAGGLYSTAADYARFCQMLLNGGSLDGVSILGHKTVELMMLNHLSQLDPPVTQFSQAEGFGLGGYVVIDPARRGQLGSPGQFGWAGAASTSYTIDRREGLVAIVLLQHLPNDRADDLPRISRHFYNLVYQALEP